MKRFNRPKLGVSVNKLVKNNERFIADTEKAKLFDKMFRAGQLIDRNFDEN